MTTMNTYEFVQDQTMLPFGLNYYASSKDAEEDGIVYMRTGDKLVAMKRIRETVKAKDIAFMPSPKSKPRLPEVEKEQLKFYFSGITEKVISDAPKIDMEKVDLTHKKSKSVAVSTGTPIALFEEE